MENVLDYHKLRKEFIERQKAQRRSRVLKSYQQNSAPMRDEKMNYSDSSHGAKVIKLKERKKEFWKYLMDEYLNNNKSSVNIVNH